MTYDPVHRRVLLATDSELWGLGDADDAWVKLDSPPSTGHVQELAWSARGSALVAVRTPDDRIPSILFQLSASDWTPIYIVPGVLNFGSNVLTNDERAGGVIAIDGTFGTAWSLVAGTWSALPALPLTDCWAAWTAYDPVGGRVWFVGNAVTGYFAATLTRSSATPFESCQPGEDLDGDGLAGCDDPDCYWACSRCLPYTSCR
jgi:hypothetical protein